MTSNTAPSGVASGSSVASSYYQHYFPFCNGACFNNTITNAWVPSESDNSPYVQYKFDNAVVAKATTVNLANTLVKSSAPTYNIEASNDGTNWTNLLTNQTATVGEIYISLNNSQAYQYYRIHFDQKINNSSTVGTWRVFKFQLYN